MTVAENAPSPAAERWQMAVMRFYYREARLLDERLFKQWQQLLSEDIRYVIPARSVPQPLREDRNSEVFHAMDRELSREGEAHWRDDDYLLLCARTDRALQLYGWAENPPARTRRLISNIEVFSDEGESTLNSLSNFLLYYSRHDSEAILYSGQRRDRLQIVDGGLRLAHRRVILDMNIIVAPTVALIF